MRYGLILLALSLWCLPARAAIAFSNSGSATATSGTIAPSVTINAGDWVVVCIGIDAAATRTITSVVDSSGSNTYAQKVNSSNGTSVQEFTWASGNVGASATSVTVTVSGPYSAADVVVATYTGPAAFGITNTNTSTSSTLTISLTTQDANNFVVANFIQHASAATVTFTASVGNLRRQQASAAGLDATGANDNTAASPSSVTNTVTSNKSATWVATALELRTVAGVTCHNHLPLLGAGCA